MYSCYTNSWVIVYSCTVSSVQFVLFVLLYSTYIHRCTNKPACTTTAVTWPVVTIMKPLPHLLQLRWRQKSGKKKEEEKTSDYSFLQKLGQRPSFAERKINITLCQSPRSIILKLIIRGQIWLILSSHLYRNVVGGGSHL